jgi:octaprenyl-diphosphate synthase
VQKYFVTFAVMKKELEEFEVTFNEVLSSEVVSMDRILGYIASVKGKRLRPKLVFLAAELFGEANETTMRTALFVEMLHTATLIHDDVVDGSDFRRGLPSVKAKWDTNTAVLTGDYLLAKAMSLLAGPSDYPILHEMLEVAMKMSEGEMMQSGKQRTENGKRRTENEKELYIEIIERKTAQLIRACCLGGALSVLEEKTEDRRQKLELVGEFGLNLGLVFQMRDDILDNDDEMATVVAEQQLPLYLEKALKGLEALAPLVKSQEAWSQLRDLTVFCAERTH